jgi:hypothetical protein
MAPQEFLRVTDSVRDGVGEKAMTVLTGEIAGFYVACVLDQHLRQGRVVLANTNQVDGTFAVVDSHGQAYGNMNNPWFGVSFDKTIVSTLSDTDEADLELADNIDHQPCDISFPAAHRPADRDFAAPGMVPNRGTSYVANDEPVRFRGQAVIPISAAK